MVLGSNGPYAASAPLRLRMGVDRGPREWPKRPEGLDGTTCPEISHEWGTRRAADRDRGSRWLDASTIRGICGLAALALTRAGRLCFR